MRLHITHLNNSGGIILTICYYPFMTSNKTLPNSRSVEAYLSEIINETQRADAISLTKLMAEVTKKEPVMWGTGIIGFGIHHYVYDSGREGETVAVGFAARKQAIVVYGLGKNIENAALASKLGMPTDVKGCLYIKNLSSIDLNIFRQMVANSFQHRNNSQTQ